MVLHDSAAERLTEPQFAAGRSVADWSPKPPSLIPPPCLAQGDSGGPVLARTGHGTAVLVGVISVGIGCGSRFPSVNVAVAPYVSWIQREVRDAESRSGSDTLSRRMAKRRHRHSTRRYPSSAIQFPGPTRRRRTPRSALQPQPRGFRHHSDHAQEKQPQEGWLRPQRSPERESRGPLSPRRR